MELGGKPLSPLGLVSQTQAPGPFVCAGVGVGGRGTGREGAVLCVLRPLVSPCFHLLGAIGVLTLAELPLAENCFLWHRGTGRLASPDY